MKLRVKARTNTSARRPPPLTPDAPPPKHPPIPQAPLSAAPPRPVMGPAAPGIRPPSAPPTEPPNKMRRLDGPPGAPPVCGVLECGWMDGCGRACV
eukprot:scaffold12348_cov19-Tisochrysis_lutea.AAC.1